MNTALACPSCSKPLAAGNSDRPFTCKSIANCGSWFGHAMLPVNVVEHANATSTFATEHPCPHCARALTRCLIDDITVGICAEHGTWVPLKGVDRFEHFFAQIARRLQAMTPAERAAHEQLKAIAAIMASFETPEGRFELAKRILTIEARLAKLERGE